MEYAPEIDPNVGIYSIHGASVIYPCRLTGSQDHTKTGRRGGLCVCVGECKHYLSLNFDSLSFQEKHQA